MSRNVLIMMAVLGAGIAALIVLPKFRSHNSGSSAVVGSKFRQHNQSGDSRAQHSHHYQNITRHDSISTNTCDCSSPNSAVDLGNLTDSTPPIGFGCIAGNIYLLAPRTHA